VVLYPYLVNGEDYDIWNKVGQAIQNLQSLKRLFISSHDLHDENDYFDENEDEDVPIPDWEIVARVLRHVRQSVTVYIEDERQLRTMEEVQPFARAIRGHPSVIGLHDEGRFPYESLDILFSTLTTLPALESVSFGAPKVRQVDESTLAYPESLTELLRVPTLRSVRFKNFSFTPALFKATANALMDGTAITNLKFETSSFPAGECAAIIATGLSRITSVISISVMHCTSAFRRPGSGASIEFHVTAS
jgi:hypothetical protein